MMRWSANRILWSVAWLSLIFGAVMTVRTFSGIPSARDRLIRAVRDARRLREIEADLAVFEKARQTFDTLPVKRPPSLESMLTASFSDLRHPDLREAESIRLDGWLLHRQEISFADASLDRVMQFVHLAEAQRPPWRLVSCAIRASPRIPGTGNVVAAFEALERGE